jgi:hypothetical protein
MYFFTSAILPNGLESRQHDHYAADDASHEATVNAERTLLPHKHPAPGQAITPT